MRDEYLKSIVYNYSSYGLSNGEKLALSNGLEYQIPVKSFRVAINTEFEQFYQRLLHDISCSQEKDIERIKTNLRTTCVKYSKIRVPYKYRKIVETLPKYSRIVIMNQDKGRDAAQNLSVYLDKCMDILDINQFTKLSTNPTKKTEKKIQGALKKLKPVLQCWSI